MNPNDIPKTAAWCLSFLPLVAVLCCPEIVHGQARIPADVTAAEHSRAFNPLSLPDVNKHTIPGGPLDPEIETTRRKAMEEERHLSEAEDSLDACLRNAYADRPEKLMKWIELVAPQSRFIRLAKKAALLRERLEGRSSTP